MSSGIPIRRTGNPRGDFLDGPAEQSALLGLAEHRRVDGARRHHVGRDALRTIFQCKGFRESVDR